MKRKVGVFLATGPHGGGSYQWALNILHGINDYTNGHDTEVTVFYFSGFKEVEYLRATFPRFNLVPIGRMIQRASGIVRRLFLHLPVFTPLWKMIFPYNWLFRSYGIDLAVFPTTLLDSGLCATRHIFFMADIAHVFYPHFPEVSAGGQLKVRHRLFSSGLANADHIVVESEQLKKDIVKHYNADPAKVTVIYQVLPHTFGQNGFSGASDVKLPERYIFYPAQLWEHKNHKNLLRALKLVLKDIPDLHLVLSGSRKEGDEKIFQFIEELGLSSHVSYLGYVSDELMARLYKNAQALVMPTYFGPSNIPTLEAFHFGCPAVISDLPGVQEQTKDAALRFNPDSPEDMAAKIVSAVKNPAVRSELIRKGTERSKELSYAYYRDSMRKLLDAALGVPQDLAIVLTGSIVPNAPFVANTDPVVRKAEYLKALKYYRQFAPVYFLENSSYQLLADPEFNQLEGVKLRKLPVSEFPNRGKGYQEFEMLDAWVMAEQELPRRFIKITGRYTYLNFDSIFTECKNENENIVIIDQYAKRRLAISHVFYMPSALYDGSIKGLYLGCDDKKRQWIEKIIYDRFSSGTVKVRTFKTDPWLNAVSGTSGELIKEGLFKHMIKVIVRKLNRLLNRQYLFVHG